MRKRTIARVSLASGTAALCLAVASPAMACTVPFDHVHQTQASDPLAAAVSRADHKITDQVHQLDAWAARIAADPNLTDAQKSDFATKISTAKSALLTQQAQADVASTVDEVTADLTSPTVTAAKAAVNVVAAIVSANDLLAGEQSRLTAQGTALANDASLLATQKADLATLVAAAQTQLAAARTAVNAATTVAGVNAAKAPTAVRTALAALTLRVAIDRADNQIDAASAKLTSWATQAAADPGLTDQQKAAVATKLTADQAKLAALRAKVDAATSPNQLTALLRAAHFSDQSWQADDPGQQPHMVKPNPTPPNQQAITQIRQPVTTVVVKKQSTAPAGSTSPKRGADRPANPRGNNGNGGHSDNGGHSSHGGNDNHGGHQH
jgi:hypothetical protein